MGMFLCVFHRLQSTDSSYSWGSVKDGEIGTVIGHDSDGDVRVNFPSAPSWLGVGRMAKQLTKVDTVDGAQSMFSPFCAIVDACSSWNWLLVSSYLIGC
jgi:hypothetical protein